MKNIAFVAILFSLNTIASGQEATKGGYVACETKEQLIEMAQAASDKDAKSMTRLLETGCFTTRSDVEVEVLEVTSSGLARIKVLSDTESNELWTYIENVHSDKLNSE